MSAESYGTWKSWRNTTAVKGPLPLFSINRILMFYYFCCCSLRKQPTFSDSTTGFLAKWRLRKERRNSTLMSRHNPDFANGGGFLVYGFHRRDRPISASPRVKFNLGFFFFCSKAFSRIIFFVIFESIQPSTCWLNLLYWLLVASLTCVFVQLLFCSYFSS